MLRYVAIGIGIVLVAGGAAAAIVIGIRLAAATPLAPRPAAPIVHNVTYRLSGTTRRAVVTSGEIDTQGQPLSVNIPWQTFTQISSGGELYISARNDSPTGTLTCEILLDGKVVDASTHSESGGKVACSGRAP